MKSVILYLGSARFSGATSIDWDSPAIGGTHRFILFLAQNDNCANQDLARREVAALGFSEIELGDGRPIDVESLNDPSMAAFRRHYEGALADGSSLVWYP